jgi:hypothetical protein
MRIDSGINRKNPINPKEGKNQPFSSKKCISICFVKNLGTIPIMRNKIK